MQAMDQYVKSLQESQANNQIVQSLIQWGDTAPQITQQAAQQEPIQQTVEINPLPPTGSVSQPEQPESESELEPKQPQPRPEPELKQDPKPVPKKNLEEVNASLDKLLEEIKWRKNPQNGGEKPEPQQQEETTEKKDKFPLDKTDELTTIVNELKEKLFDSDMKMKDLQLKNQYLEQQLEAKANDEAEIYEKFRNLERDMKKQKAAQIDPQITKLNDNLKLYSESNTLYNERGVLAEAAKIIENITKLDMSPYIMEYYKAGSWFNSEEGAVSEPEKTSSSTENKGNSFAKNFF